jgi:hypothetical protein
MKNKLEMNLKLLSLDEQSVHKILQLQLQNSFKRGSEKWWALNLDLNNALKEKKTVM